MNFDKIREMLKNKKVQAVSGAVVGALIIAVAGTMILSNKGKVDNEKQVVVATNKEDNSNVEKQLKSQLEKLKQTDISKLSEEDRKAIEEQSIKIEEFINKKEYDKAKVDIVKLIKDIEKKTIKNENKSEDKKEETIKVDYKDAEAKKEESNKEVASNRTENSTSSSEVNTGNTNTNNNQSNAGNTSNNTTPSHSHNWNPITEVVYHDEVGHWEDVVISEAWTEEVLVYEEVERAICNGCGLDITDNITGHNREHALNGEQGGWHTEWKQVQVGTNTVNHPAVIEKKWTIDKEAWNETVIKGYNCSCGATK